MDSGGGSSIVASDTLQPSSFRAFIMLKVWTSCPDDLGQAKRRL